MEEKKPLSIMIATPTMGEVPIQYAQAIVAMVLKTKQKYPDCEMSMATVVRKMHHRARTELAETFLQVPEFTHMLFVDDDNIPKPDDLNKLIELDLPIVSGLYFRRTPPYEPIIMLSRANGVGTERRPDLYRSGSKEPFKAHSTGLGFCLIKREVIEGAKKLGMPLFDVRGGVGEDIWFCLQVHGAGYDIWIAPDVEVAHLGEKEVVVGKTYMDYYDKHILELVEETVKIEGRYNKEELRCLAERGATSNLTIDIGSDQGQTAIALSNSTRIICVEDWKEGFENYGKFVSNVKKYHNIDHLKGDILELADNFKDNCADLIFINPDMAKLEETLKRFAPKMKISAKMIIGKYEYHKAIIDKFVEENKLELALDRIKDTGFCELIKY